MGPGRYRAFIAIRSSMAVGFNFLRNSRIPDDSNWNTPIVSPFEKSLYTLESSSGIFSISISFSRSFKSFRVLSITVRLRKPRKSSLRRPNSSKPFISYWEVTSPCGERYKGTKSVKSPGAITTPAAWMDAWRFIPSNTFECSITSLYWPSAALLRFGFCFKASFKVIFIVLGIIFANLSISPKEYPRTRPTSRITWRAFILPNVMICVTEFSPYCFLM